MARIIKYIIGAVAIFGILYAINLALDGGQIMWVSNTGITIVIVTAWVVIDRYSRSTNTNSKKQKKAHPNQKKKKR